MSRLRFTLSVMIVVIVLLAGVSDHSPAGAQRRRSSDSPYSSGRDSRAEASGTSVRVETSSGGGQSGRGRSSSAPRWNDCVDFGLGWADVVDSGAWVRDHGLMRATIRPRGEGNHWRECRQITTGQLGRWLVDPDATPGPIAADLVAHQALGQVQLDLPEVATSPPRGSDVMLVGVPIWFWVSDARPVTATAEVPGLSATLTATPVRFGATATPATDRGTEESFTCDGTGEAWQQGVHGAREASDCSITFDWNDSYQIDATVDWELTWTASNGETGALPDVQRTSSFTIRIWQAQAVTD